MENTMILKPISEVERVYSGKPGCMCGCNGNYFEDPKNIKRIYNILAKNLEKCYISPTTSYAAINLSPTRKYVVYFKGTI